MPSPDHIHTGPAVLRSMFFKLVPTFVLVGFAAMVLSSVLTSALWKQRAQADMRALSGQFQQTEMAALVSGLDLRDPAQCRQAADKLFWHVVQQGLNTVMDFGPMLAHFADGRLQVRVNVPSGDSCSSAPDATALLAQAFTAVDARTHKGIATQKDGAWAEVTRMDLGNGANALIGMHYRPDWQLHDDVVNSTGYDVLRTTLYLVAMGASFAAVLVGVSSFSVQ